MAWNQVVMTVKTTMTASKHREFKFERLGSKIDVLQISFRNFARILDMASRYIVLTPSHTPLRMNSLSPVSRL